MKHPQYDLLIAAANDVDARFECSNWNNHQYVPIGIVTINPSYNWKLVDKFAKLKKAYAEGKAIEVRCPHSGWQTVLKPTWESYCEYRIKPEPVYEWQWLCREPDGRFYVSVFFTCPPANTYKCIEESKREVKS